VCGLLDVGRAGRVFATDVAADVAADGSASGRTIVQFVICVTVIIPTAVTKVLDIIVDKRQHGHRLCKILAPAPVVVLAAAMTTSTVNGRCQQRNCDQGNKAASNGTLRGLLTGSVVVIGISLLASSSWLGAFDSARTTLNVLASAVAAVAALGGRVAPVITRVGVVVLHVGRGRKAVHCCPRCPTPPRPGPVAMA
jgi:hypothetical protein